jgi:hypothetical protein
LKNRDRRIRRTRDGSYRLQLTPNERDLLRALPGQVRQLIDADDPSVFRLFPSAYPDDPEREAEFTALVHDELMEHHLDALATLERTVDDEQLDEEQVLSWLRALNDLRLVLGTRLDITEDLTDVSDDDPRAPALGVYGYLTWLQEQVVEAISE